MKFNKIKVIGLILPFLMLTMVSAKNNTMDANAIVPTSGSWFTIQMEDYGGIFGTYEYVSTKGHYKATETYFSDGMGVPGYYFTRMFKAPTYIPSTYVTTVRVKFYVEDAVKNVWIWGFNENFHVSVYTSDGSIYYPRVEIDSDAYQTGAYVTLYLSSSAAGHKLIFSIIDDSGLDGYADGGADKWYVDPPVIEYYRNIPII